jgi:CheY-like chemotaxis protein
MIDSTVTILLVDDDKVDTMAVKRSFRDLKIANLIIEAYDGIAALERLRGPRVLCVTPRQDHHSIGLCIRHPGWKPSR